MPTYPLLPLDEIAEVFVGLARQGRVARAQKYGLRMSLIGMKAIHQTGLNWEAIETVSLMPDIDPAFYQIAADDLLITCRGTDVRLALAPEKAAGMLVDSNIIVVRCGPQFLPAVLHAYFRHPAGRNVLEKASQSTTKQKNLTVRALKKIKLPAPPLSRQHQLARLLAAAERQHALALAAAEKRLEIARQITLNTLFENGG